MSNVVTYTLTVTVTRTELGDYQVNVECKGFAGAAHNMFVESAFKAAHEECMARLAEGAKPL
jgi:hypothetical protein